VFSVQDQEGRPFGDENRLARLRRTILGTLEGQVSPRALLAKSKPRAHTGAFEVHPRVNCDNAASATATVIEVEAADRPGLLYDITRAIFECGLSISSAMVATYGERAIDVFYVRDGFGHKLTHAESLHRLEQRLLEALASPALDTTSG